jgi:hypothetical protein
MSSLPLARAAHVGMAVQQGEQHREPRRLGIASM